MTDSKDAFVTVMVLPAYKAQSLTPGHYSLHVTAALNPFSGPSQEISNAVGVLISSSLLQSNSSPNLVSLSPEHLVVSSCPFRLVSRESVRILLFSPLYLRQH